MINVTTGGIDLAKNVFSLQGVDGQGREVCAALTTFFDYPADIREVLYTTYAIESLNFPLRLVLPPICFMADFRSHLLMLPSQ